MLAALPDQARLLLPSPHFNSNSTHSLTHSLTDFDGS